MLIATFFKLASSKTCPTCQDNWHNKMETIRPALKILEEQEKQVIDRCSHFFFYGVADSIIGHSSLDYIGLVFWFKINKQIVNVRHVCIERVPLFDLYARTCDPLVGLLNGSLIIGCNTSADPKGSFDRRIEKEEENWIYSGINLYACSYKTLITVLLHHGSTSSSIPRERGTSSKGWLFDWSATVAPSSGL